MGSGFSSNKQTMNLSAGRRGSITVHSFLIVQNIVSMTRPVAYLAAAMAIAVLFFNIGCQVDSSGPKDFSAANIVTSPARPALTYYGLAKSGDTDRKSVV